MLAGRVQNGEPEPVNQKRPAYVTCPMGGAIPMRVVQRNGFNLSRDGTQRVRAGPPQARSTLALKSNGDPAPLVLGRAMHDLVLLEIGWTRPRREVINHEPQGGTQRVGKALHGRPRTTRAASSRTTRPQSGTARRADRCVAPRWRTSSAPPRACPGRNRKMRDRGADPRAPPLPGAATARRRPRWRTAP